MVGRYTLRLFGLALIPALVANAQASKPAEEKPSIQKTEVGSTPNVSTLGEKAYFGGQPKAADLKAFADLGVKTVINLRTEGEMQSLSFDEEKAVTDAGMKYIQVPLDQGEITDEQIQTLLATIDEANKEKFLIHCGSSNRVGYAWSLFSGKKLGKPVDEAIAEGKAAGMQSSQLEADARKRLGEKPTP